ncbi:DMT family transporter [Pseudoroseicyclus sp. H15]
MSVIIGTVLALSLGDALIKGASERFALSQIFVLRSALALPVLALLLTARGRLGWPKAPGWVALRSAMLVAMWLLYYLALPRLQLSAAAAAYYTLPIFITLFSALFLRQRIAWLGWLAVALGFAGVLLILSPRPGDFNAFALLPLGAAVLYAGAMLLTRTRCRQEEPLMLALALNAAFVVAGGALAGIATLSPGGGLPARAVGRDGGGGVDGAGRAGCGDAGWQSWRRHCLPGRAAGDHRHVRLRLCRLRGGLGGAVLR